MSRPTQQIRFCASRDGTRIAYASCGSGPPLIWAAHWVGHLQLSWDSQVWRPWLALLMARHTLIRYDARGCGLSDREVADFSLDRHLEDLEAVVAATRLERFDLFGVAGGSGIAVRYAARHPEHVTRLVVHGCYARAKLVRAANDDEQRKEALTQIEAVGVGWGMNNPAYRQLFTSQLIPNATAEQFREFNDLIQATTSPANAARILRAFYEVDLREFAPQVRCPALVLHSTHDGRIPFEEGRSLAGLISGARFVALQSHNHLPLEKEPAWRQLVDEVQAFLAQGLRSQKPRTPLQDDITSRESEILELMARGLDNKTIAARLSIAQKTVRNHVSNIFEKLGASSRAQAIIRARDAGYGMTDDASSAGG
jgi:pimeloyl-ACP methyl ester carboxylesterase/DNA-binding CsgD family transcriptional regulator